MDSQQLFDLTSRPDAHLFFKSKDPNDLRLGAIIRTAQQDYDQAQFVLVSCSQDAGIQRNSGRIGAASGPDSIRTAFYRLTVPEDFSEQSIFDLGDTCYDAELEDIHERHFQIVKKLLTDKKKVIVLGGGNDLSYPDGKAMNSVYPQFACMNIDAHLDIRINEKCNSGTPYRQLIDEKLLIPENFYEMAIQPHANAPAYLRQIREWGVNLITLAELTWTTIYDSMMDKFDNVSFANLMLGFDMDSVKAADAPGVSAPSPIGLTAEQALDITKYVTNSYAVNLFEITEVNPSYDLDNKTSKLAAILMYAYICTVNMNDK